MPGYTEYVLAEGSFSYGQAVAVITAYQRPVQRCRCVPPGPGLSAADETTGTHAHQR